MTILCRILGHHWRPFDMGWAGQDQWRCFGCQMFVVVDSGVIPGRWLPVDRGQTLIRCGCK